jgi:Uma2 family endonuclease
MVMTSRRVHHPEPADRSPRLPTSVREFYDWLPELPLLKIEIINGRVIVSPRGNPRQSWVIGQLVRVFGPGADERGWRAWPEVDVCIAWTREPLIPDFAMGPKNAPVWGERKIISDGLILVSEVVSANSVREDREDKPLIYARGKVPILLIVDHEAEPKTVTAYSRPTDDGYQTITTVKMGDELPIPAPVSFTLNTSVFLDET